MYIFLLHLYLLSTSLCLHYTSFTHLITRLLKTLKFFAKEPRSQLELSRFDYFFLQQIATTLLIQPLKFQILKLCFLNPIGHFLPRPWFKFAGYLTPTFFMTPGFSTHWLARLARLARLAQLGLIDATRQLKKEPRFDFPYQMM